MLFKVHIFWEGHKILQNLHQLFVLCTASQIIGGDFAKFCVLLRINELKIFDATEVVDDRQISQYYQKKSFTSIFAPRLENGKGISSI